MDTISRSITVLVLTTLLWFVSPLDVSAAPVYSSKPAKTESQTADLHAKGTAAVNAGNFAEAERCFAEAHQLDPKDADALNMLAYSQRKQGKLTEAFHNYDKALKLRPKFPEAREYLGEAHIQAALKEIETLKSYGDEGKHALEELIAAFNEAAAQLK